MRDAVIVDAVRTPVGKRGGSLSRLHSASLSAHVLNALVERTGLDPVLVDDVIWGCASAVGMQAGCVGRASVLAAGWPETVPGVTVDRQCGSSQQAVHQAAAGVVAGQYDVAVTASPVAGALPSRLTASSQMSCRTPGRGPTAAGGGPGRPARWTKVRTRARWCRKQGRSPRASDVSV